MRKIVLGILGTVFCTLVVSNADAACPPGWREANVRGGGITCVRPGPSFGDCMRNRMNKGFNDQAANARVCGRMRWECPAGSVARYAAAPDRCGQDWAGRGFDGPP